jgi:putative protein kinase ArgK-like GTPase of G3E family
MTIANLSSGVEPLYQAILAHMQYLRDSGEWDRRERARITAELGKLLEATLVERWKETVSAEEYHRVIDGLLSRDVSPQMAVSQLLRNSEKAWARANQESE